MLGLAGVSNIGKSSFVRSLTLELVLSNPDILVINMSIDDAFQKVIPGYISLLTGLSISEIRMAKFKIWHDKAKQQLWTEGWRQINNLSDRLIVKDVSDGGTTIALEKYIKYYQRLCPDKKVFCIVDNFHKLRDYADLEGRSRYNAISSRIKELTINYNVPILNVLEIRKQSQFGMRPTLQDIKETIEIEYDCDLVWLLHQELHVNPNTDMRWQAYTEYGELTEMPINELTFAKNKEGGYKGTVYFRFRTDRSQYIELSQEELQNIKNTPDIIINDPITPYTVTDAKPTERPVAVEAPKAADVVSAYLDGPKDEGIDSWL